MPETDDQDDQDDQDHAVHGDPADHADKSERAPRPWPWPTVPVAAFLASRVVTMAAAYAVRFVLGGYGILRVMTRWDAAWYMVVAEDGYPSNIPTGGGAAAQSPLGFFPLFPLLTRAAAALPGMGIATAAVVVNTVFSLLAAVLVWRLAAEVFDRETADRTAFLLCFFVGSYAFTYAYTEGVFIAASAACLLLLHRRRFWAAALVAGVGSAARPTGFVLALACATAVVVHWRERRDWKPLASPLLAASGYIAFHVYLHFHTGDAFAWQRVQERGWGQRTDFGETTVRRMIDFVQHPVHDLNLLVPIVTVLTLVPLAWMLWRARPPLPWLVFTGFSLLPGLVSTSVALTPRHVFAAFPLVIGAAWTLRSNVYALALATSAALLGVVMFVTGATGSLTP